VARWPKAGNSVLPGQTGIAFDDVQVRRVDWPAPATPGWQLYEGAFALGSSSASLAPVGGSVLNLAVREGTYGRNYDIEAQIQGSKAGIAFHVQDKLNYYCVEQVETSLGGGSYLYKLYIWRIEDGQPQDAGSWSQTISDANQPRHLHIRTADDDLEVWVYLDGDWQCAVDPLYGGYDLLDGSQGGAVGLTCDPGGDTAVCSLLRVGSLTSGHTFSSGQAAVDETFAATFSTTRDIPEKLEYDPAGLRGTPYAFLDG
jgi:hypothetical protein